MLADNIHTILMGYFHIKRQPVLRNMRKPHELLLAEMISSDEPVPVPVDYAREKIFTDIALDEFCELFRIRYRVVTYSANGHRIDRAYYEFSFISEE